MADYVKLHDDGYPLARQLGGNDGEEKVSQCIPATAGLPGFRNGCTPNAAPSSYAKKYFTFLLKTGGGGTAANKQFVANNGENLVGTGGE